MFILTKFYTIPYVKPNFLRQTYPNLKFLMQVCFAHNSGTLIPTKNLENGCLSGGNEQNSANLTQE